VVDPGVISGDSGLRSRDNRDSQRFNVITDERAENVRDIRISGPEIPQRAGAHTHLTRRSMMPLINVKIIEDVFSPEQKHQIVSKLTDAMVTIEGEAMRSVTWVVVEEVKSGDWGIAGRPLTTADVKALAASRPAKAA
jgi:4-oxalocrotonate tautomerase